MHEQCWFVCLLLLFNRPNRTLFLHKNTLHRLAAPLQSQNSEYSSSVLCAFKILNASFVSVCTIHRRRMQCACVSASAFTSDWSRWGFFFSFSIYLMRLICSNDWYSSLSLLFLLQSKNFMSIGSNITFVVHFVYISFKLWPIVVHTNIHKLTVPMAMAISLVSI